MLLCIKIIMQFNGSAIIGILQLTNCHKNKKNMNIVVICVLNLIVKMKKLRYE